ncbi:hypothetical protein [Mesorhizobium sp. SP-1A]|uniref:hypothetical protein n=1 Tax=Mesorhizobium sp. SP-1A TaxID=3077840 RepID=UPI0028F72C43|nr:hypothetical protein [Mesorhizobium sp. SP-1A]
MAQSLRDKITHEQAQADHDYLWQTYGPAYDMTGAYDEHRDMEMLLRKPSKKTAIECYCSRIRYWFEVGPQVNSPTGDLGSGDIDWHDFKVIDIAVRHGFISEEDSMDADFLTDLYLNRSTLLRKKRD